MKDIRTILKKEIFPFLSPSVSTILDKMPEAITAKLSEIRLRMDKPLLVVLLSGDCVFDVNGQTVKNIAEAYICTKEDIGRALQVMSRNSIYAMEKELKQGYLTLAGGHRVGLAGQAITENEQIKTLKNISSLNIRIAREVVGCADKILPYLVEANHVSNTLIISPPRCGKTTILRDIARQLSIGIPSLSFEGIQIGIVDERSEIAACVDGIPSMELGFRTDVLDGCPKAQGMLMLIRSMGPGAILTDELGRKEDAEAVQEAMHAGVSVIATVHGRSVEDILERPFVGELAGKQWFDRFVVLGRTPQPGIVEEIRNGANNSVLYSRKKDVRICG